MTIEPGNTITVTRRYWLETDTGWEVVDGIAMATVEAIESWTNEDYPDDVVTLLMTDLGCVSLDEIKEGAA